MIPARGRRLSPIIFQPYKLLLPELVGDHPKKLNVVCDKRSDLPRLAACCLVAPRRNFEACLIKGSRYFIQLDVENVSIALHETLIVPSKDHDLSLSYWSHCCIDPRREILKICDSEWLPLDRLIATCKCFHVYSLHAVDKFYDIIPAAKDVDVLL